MRVAIPHMGNLYIPVKTLFENIGIDYVMPPVNNQHTLFLGARHSPEGLCVPFKMTLGNLIEAAEMGADTMLMPGGYGICRLGYYSRVQRQIVKDLGHNMEIIEIGVSERKFLGLLDLIKKVSNNAPWLKIIGAFRFGLAKLNALDNMERLVQKARPVEKNFGSANRIYARAVEAIDRAGDRQSLLKVTREYTAELTNIEKRSGERPLVVGITGEFYVVLEPFSSFDVERELGKLGVEVRRNLFVSEWTRFSLFLNPLGINEKRENSPAVLPYLKRDIGGDGWETVGEKVLHAQEYDGMVHLAPFTCMPEIIAENILPSTREKIPVLTILCDEQIARAGVLTRLEAFVDLLERKRRVQQKVS